MSCALLRHVKHPCHDWDYPDHTVTEQRGDWGGLHVWRTGPDLAFYRHTLAKTSLDPFLGAPWWQQGCEQATDAGVVFLSDAVP